MAKKKEEPVEETSKSSSKKESLECLIDLVEESDVPYFRMMMDLSRTGLDKQLEEEIRLRKLGEPIEPTITKSEFNKEILGA